MPEDISGKICQTLIEAAKRDRHEFITIGEEIDGYAYAKIDEPDMKMFQGEDAFKAKVAKMAQAIDIFGPYMYPSNPTRRVVTRDWADDYAKIRNGWMEKYLNYTPNETDLYGESHICINEALIYGRGVMWTGFNARKNLCHSVTDTVKNFLVDPDARSKKDVNWKGRRRYKPRWEMEQRYPQAEAILANIDANTERPSDTQAKKRDPTTEMLESVEIYCRVGLHHYNQGFQLINTERDQGMADDSPRKYVVCGDKIVWSGPWEVPWWRIDEWPCSELDFRERTNRMWPASPLAVGLSHQRALNHIYCVYMNRMLRSYKNVLAIMEENGEQALSQDDLTKIFYGTEDMPVIRVKWNGQPGVKIGDLIQKLDLMAGSEEFEQLFAVISREFEEATGLYPILHQGDVGRQMRSKAEVDLKESSSKTRINYYKERVERHQSALARKEAIAAMFLQPRDEIANIFGLEAKQQFGQILPPQQAAMTPFGVDFERALREADFIIEAGSMRAQGPEQAQDAAEMFMNQGFPALMNAGQPIPALAGAKAWAVINHMPTELVQAFDMAIDQQVAQMQAQQQMQQQQAAMAQQGGPPPGPPGPPGAPPMLPPPGMPPGLPPPPPPGGPAMAPPPGPLLHPMGIGR